MNRAGLARFFTLSIIDLESFIMKSFGLFLCLAVVAVVSIAIFQTASVAHAQSALTTSRFDACACETGPLPDVLATVNGAQIKTREIEDVAGPKVGEVQKQVSDARARELDYEINARLADQEAKKRGITTGQLMQQEVVKKI